MSQCEAGSGEEDEEGPHFRVARVSGEKRRLMIKLKESVEDVALKVELELEVSVVVCLC